MHELMDCQLNSVLLCRSVNYAVIIASISCHQTTPTPITVAALYPVTGYIQYKTEFCGEVKGCQLIEISAPKSRSFDGRWPQVLYYIGPLTEQLHAAMHSPRNS